MQVEIEPVEIEQRKICDRLYLQLRNLNFNESVTINVLFMEKYDNIGLRIIDDKCIIISGDEYKAWGTDDNYIIDLVLSKLGYKQYKII